jgi:outer membrane protein OmpA-like peptidoglycan-associated protein
MPTPPASAAPLCTPASSAPAVARSRWPPSRAARPIRAGDVPSVTFGPWEASFRFEVPRGPVQGAEAAPTQQSVAATLRATGRVALYIQFRFDSAEILPAAEPVLAELRDALAADPTLRLALVGHTDAVGTPAHNRALSLRRARAVAAWLTARGVDPQQLTVDGRGPEEPIADDGSEFGRAANRRVEAVRAP